MGTTYPIYKKTNCHFFKIISDKSMVAVTKGNIVVINCIQHYDFVLGIVNESEDSNELEFIDAFDYVRTKLEEL